MAGGRGRTRPAQGPVRAAAYLRMSTRDQIHSLGNQAAAIAAYAARHGYDLVRTYEDAGISGRRADNRGGFKGLLATVLGGAADFTVILVYDVSRWGRFADPDQAGHYEFLCAQEGVRVEYCAEPFQAGAGPGADLVKGLKRAMAAEFSRDLGAKVGQAQSRLAAEGYWQHGSPGYGLRRQLVDAEDRPVRLLKRGERNRDPSHRTRLVAGPRRERRVVRRIHRAFAEQGLDMAVIARSLNAEGLPAEDGARWTAVRVRQILTNPKYVGDLVSRRRRRRPDGRRELREADAWVVAEGAGPALVSRAVFAATQAALAAREGLSDTALLDLLRTVAATHGVVSEPRLKALGHPQPRAYRTRFGSLKAAYAAIGAATPRSFPKRISDKAMLDALVRLHRRAGTLSRAGIDAAQDVPHSETYRKRFGSLAKAFARIGFVALSRKDLASPVGRARAEAMAARLACWRFGEPDTPAGWRRSEPRRPEPSPGPA